MRDEVRVKEDIIDPVEKIQDGYNLLLVGITVFIFLLLFFPIMDHYFPKGAPW